MNKRIPVLELALISAAALSAALPVKASNPTAGATVSIEPGVIRYTLPHYFLGAKMTAYSADIVVGRYEGHPAPLTADGKTFDQLILESGLDSVSQSMMAQGTPDHPNEWFDDVRKLQAYMVKGTTINGITYRGGAACSPHFTMGVDIYPKPTTRKPESLPLAPANSEASKETIRAWLDRYASDFGVRHIMTVEFYNEPATMNDRQSGRRGGAWYAYADFPNADRLCADFATCAHRVVDDYVRARYPALLTCGGSYSEGAGNHSWDPKEIERFIAGYSGWPWGKDPNTHHMAAFSSHGYGSAIANGLPGAAGGKPQSIFNSVFYPENSTVAKPGVQGGKSGFVAMQNLIRQRLDAHGGASTRMVMSEWWKYDAAIQAPPQGAYTALGDVLGVIAAGQHADIWKYAAFILHSINASTLSNDETRLSLHDSMFGVSWSPYRLWRTQRYFVLRDMLAPFASRTGVKRLVRVTTTSPPSPGGPADNPVNAIQAVAGINADGRRLEILAANVDTVSAHRVRFVFQRPAEGLITGVRLQRSLKMDTPLPPVKEINYADGSRTSFADTLSPAGAALYVVTLAPKSAGGKTKN